MKLLNRKLDNKTAFNLLQNSDHIMAVKGETLTILGIIIRDEVNADGEVVTAHYALTKDKAYFGGAASFGNALRELAGMFEEDVLGAGLDVVFDTKEVGKNSNTIWFATLA